MSQSFKSTRRRFFKWLGSMALTITTPWPLWSQSKAVGEKKKESSPGQGTVPLELIQKKIPSSGQTIPVIGMGTWITFNVGKNSAARKKRTEVLRAFFEGGGGLIDSSPMYGSAEEVVGHCLSQLKQKPNLFTATKVWTSDPSEGPEQVTQSEKFWGVEKLDLEQVHNLVSWEEHLEMLFELKKQGELGHVGVTTSHGRRHSDLERVMREQPLDFVQLTYNIQNREVEKRLLPLAKEKGIGVIANRPYAGGTLVKGMQRRGVKLPQWANEFDCQNWPQFLLKYIVSHPAVTCAIPATSQVDHMKENMGAAVGSLPNPEMRKKMGKFFTQL